MLILLTYESEMDCTTRTLIFEYHSPSAPSASTAFPRHVHLIYIDDVVVLSQITHLFTSTLCLISHDTYRKCNNKHAITLMVILESTQHYNRGTSAISSFKACLSRLERAWALLWPTMMLLYRCSELFCCILFNRRDCVGALSAVRLQVVQSKSKSKIFIRFRLR